MDIFLQILTIIGLCLAGLFCLVLLIGFLQPERLVNIVMRMVGGMQGLRWRTHDGWPVFEGGTSAEPGDPPLLLIHGFGVDKNTMFDLARVLVRKHQVVAVDLPGFGDHVMSDPADINMDLFTNKLEQLLDHLGFDQVIPVGSSMGGAISSMFAARHPERVAGLCLIGPAGLEPPVETEIYAMGKREENPLRINDLEDFENLIKLNFTNPPYIPRNLRKALMRKAVAAADFHEEVMMNMSEYLMDGVRPNLSRIHCPVTVIWGGDDKIIHPSVAPHWEEGLRDVEMNMIPAVGHSTMMERPKEVGDIIDRFITRLRTSVNR